MFAQPAPEVALVRMIRQSVWRCPVNSAR